MEQLIKITTVPIAIEMKIENAKIQRQSKTAKLEISQTDGGGIRMKSQPVKLKLDTFDIRNQISPSPLKSVEKSAQKGMNAAYTATGRYAENGKMYLEGQMGEDVTAKIIEQLNAPKNVQVNMGAYPAPNTGVKTQVTPGQLSMMYDMDKLNFDVRNLNGDFEFIPASIDIEVTQYPDVRIEYLGEPIYVPPRDEAQ